MRRSTVVALLLALVGSCLTVGGPSAVGATAAAGDDTVITFGDAWFAGSTSAAALNDPLIDFAATPDGLGYWLLGRDGGVFSFGTARFHGSTGSEPLNEPVVTMAPTSTGSGYWLVAADGGVFTFGDAAFHGSAGSLRLARPIVAMDVTPSGLGYWLVAADGGVFTYGDARFHGSAAGLRLGLPVVDFASTPTGDGYWMVGADGAVFAFGDAPYHGNAPGNARVAGIAPAADGEGYWLADEEGGVFTFGSAQFAGSAFGAIARDRRVVSIEATSTGDGYWLTAASRPPVPEAAAGGTAALQARLDALGYWVPVDGRSGSLTTQALYAIQKSAGIARTGTFDAATQRALDDGVVPRPRSTTGYVAEVDKARQIVMLVSNGRVVRVFNTSTGNGARYRSGGGWAIAHTPEGQFHIYTQINALRISELGELWRPKYFTGGYAMHGSPSIPPYPASHGCVRLSNAAINWMWDTGSLPLGTTVLVYS